MFVSHSASRAFNSLWPWSDAARTALVIASFLCLPQIVRADGWNQWRGPNRDGVAVDSPPLRDALPPSGLKPLWVARDLPNARSGGWSSPVVADGRVYLFTHKRYRVGKGKLRRPQFPYLPPEKRKGMSDEEYREYERKRRAEQEARAKAFRFDETLYCLDAKTGRVLWQNTAGSKYTRFSQSGSPAVVAGRIYVLGAGRLARCIDAASGKDLWQRRLPGDFRDEFMQSSFLVERGVAAVLCGQLFGLDTETGEIRWTVGDPRNGSLHSSPVVWRKPDRSVLIANLDGKQTVGVDAMSGKRLWSVPSQAGHSTPVVVGDRLLTYSNSRKKGLRCFQLSADGAELLWTFQGVADPGSSPVAIDDHVYVQGDRRLVCVDLASGKARWQTRLDLNRPRYTSLVSADNKILYAFDGVLCFRASAQRFEPLMQAKIDGSGLLAEEAEFRRRLNIDKLEQSAEGQREAEKLWRKHIDRNGPLACSTPALAAGRLYIRLRDGVACYDLRAVR